MNFTIQGPHLATTTLCAPILRALPGWFGIEEALDQYCAQIDNLPTFLARGPQGVTGFLSIKQHNPYAAEVYVMGVLPSAHRRGLGRALMDAAQAWLRERGVEYLQVKTLGPSHEDPGYAKTRDFYLALGFRPLEEFTRIWDEANPCLILVKRL